MNENDFEKIESLIARHVGTFADSIQHKLDIVVEGHQMLSEKLDRVEARLDSRIDCVVRKLDAVAAETSANTVAIRGLTYKVDNLTAETSANTVAIRGLTHKVDNLAAETSANTVAIRGLTHKVDNLTVESSAHTVALQDLTHKVDNLAVDLSAHRTDTEAHRPVYRVKE